MVTFGGGFKEWTRGKGSGSGSGDRGHGRGGGGGGGDAGIVHVVRRDSPRRGARYRTASPLTLASWSRILTTGPMKT